MTHDTSQERDLRIIRSILAAIYTGEFPMLAAYERTFRDIYQRLSAEPYTLELWDFLAREPNVAREGIQVTLQKIIEFTEKELSKYAAIKAERPLTDSEKQYGNEVLLPLLEGASNLIKNHPFNRSGSGERTGPPI
jgi:hypothetical protein